MITNNQELQAMCREAYNARDKKLFGDRAVWLLNRGYAPVLGARGGLSFQWVGHTREGDETWLAVRNQFSTVAWKGEAQ